MLYAVTFDRLFGAGVTLRVAHVIDVESFPGQNLLSVLIIEIRELYTLQIKKQNAVQDKQSK